MTDSLARWTSATCPHCACERLACPWGETLLDGWPIICGRCGALSIFRVEEPERGTASRFRIEIPTRTETLRLRQDDQVAAWLAAYDQETARQLKERHPAGRALSDPGLPLGLHRRPGAPPPSSPRSG